MTDELSKAERDAAAARNAATKKALANHGLDVTSRGIRKLRQKAAKALRHAVKGDEKALADLESIVGAGLQLSEADLQTLRSLKKL